MVQKNNGDPEDPANIVEDPEVLEPSTEDQEANRKIRRTTTEIQISASQFSGPLPPPELLKGYNEAFAGCAERVVAMAEAQSRHRQALENRVIDSNCANETRAQWFAFILALVVIVGGVYLLAMGKSVQGFSAIILAVGSLAGALIYGRTEQRKERSRKLQSLPSQPKPSPPGRPN
jgi:uncharacterized membrane protein